MAVTQALAVFQAFREKCRQTKMDLILIMTKNNIIRIKVKLGLIWQGNSFPFVINRIISGALLHTEAASL